MFVTQDLEGGRMERLPCLFYIEVITLQVSSPPPMCPTTLSSVSCELLIHLYYTPIEAKHMFGAPAIQELIEKI